MKLWVRSLPWQAKLAFVASAPVLAFSMGLCLEQGRWATAFVVVGLWTLGNVQLALALQRDRQ